MARTLAITLAALAGLPALPSQEMPLIRAHRFEGRAWIPAEQLEARLGLDRGSPYDPRAVAEALERLLSFRFIQEAGPPEVSLLEGGREVELTWPIRERPLVRGVYLSYPTGRRPFTSEELLSGLRTRTGGPLIRRDLQEDGEAIREKYRGEGYALCEVRGEAREVATGAVEVEFTIQSGPWVAVRSVEVLGCRQIPARQVLAAIRTRKRILFGFISRGAFQPGTFEEDLERIRNFYRLRGYLEVVVAADPPRFSGDFSRVDLTIRLEEGPRYTLSAVQIRGNGPGIPTELLMRQVRTRADRPYDGESLEEDRRRLVIWYQRQYDLVPRIKLRREYPLSREDHRVTAVLEIDERDHFFTGRVEFRGNFRTRDRVIRSALAVRPGEPLTRLALEKTIRQLADLGYFEPEKIEVTVARAGETRDIEIRLEERKAGLIEVAGGASTGEGEVGYFSITQPNFDLFAIPGINSSLQEAFTGGGQFFQALFAPGTRQSQFAIRFEEPYLYNTHHALQAQGGSRVLDYRDYEETRLGGELALRRFWDRGHSFSTRLGYVLDNVEISDIAPGAPPEIAGWEGHTLFSYPFLQLTYNLEEQHRLSGPAGFKADARGDLSTSATGSEAEFFRIRLAAGHHQPVSALLNDILPGEPLSEEPGLRHVFYLGGQFGWVREIDGGGVPISERFFLGGPRSLRGFDYRGVGPAVNGFRVGGNAYYLGTVEYSFPLVIPELRAVALFEFADLEPEISDLSGGRIRTAVGGGLRIRMQVLGQFFPINLYFMEALTREPQDSARFFTFNLGLGF